MTQSDVNRSAAYYDARASQYDADLTVKETDRLARSAFQDLVMQSVRRPATILDLGCGTGIDAQHYARHGHRVLAYDNSEGMLARLRERCAPEIAAGQVVPCSFDYASFLARLTEWPPPDVVAANFAVVNMIPDLAPLFGVFAAHLSAPGWLVVCVLNPLRRPRVALRTWWHGRHVRGTTASCRLSENSPTYLHLPSAVLEAAPQFHVTGIAHAGRFVRYDALPPVRARRWWGRPASMTDRFARLAWATPIASVVSQFIFFVLRRDP